MIFRPTWPSRSGLAGPFGGFDQLRREMLRLFDAVGDTRGEGAGIFPPLNVSQDDNAVHVRAEVPGVRPDQLTVTALGNRLTIAGERQIPDEKEDVSYHRSERSGGSFSRSLVLPSEVEADRVEARCADGVLTLRLPKAERAKPKQIVVKQ